MRSALATLCLALALAGCRGTGNGLFGQMTIPPPGTQPPGALLADNSYYPAVNPMVGSSPISTSAATPVLASNSGALQPNTLPSGPTTGSDSQLADRRGAAISRANLGAPARSTTSSSREEPIRIPDDSATAGTLAAVIPIRGVPTTDATGLFEQIRSQLTSQTNLAAQPRVSSGFVEISQLPNPPEDVRRAALSKQQLR